MCVIALEKTKGVGKLVYKISVQSVQPLNLGMQIERISTGAAEYGPESSVKSFLAAVDRVSTCRWKEYGIG